MSPLDDPDESMLLRLAQSGDNEAWNTLVLRHGGMLRRLASLKLDPRLCARFGPDDVVQEAIFEIFQSLGNFFEDRLPLTIWLRQRLIDRLVLIHRNQLMTQKRDARRDIHTTIVWECHPLDPGSSPSNRTMRTENGQLLQAAISQLAESDRELIFLVFFEGYPYCDVATILGIKPATMRQRLRRAVDKVGDILRQTHPEWCHAIKFAC